MKNIFWKIIQNFSEMKEIHGNKHNCKRYQICVTFKRSFVIHVIKILVVLKENEFKSNKRIKVLKLLKKVKSWFIFLKFSYFQLSIKFLYYMES